ncbi:MAG TPA: hypothetical protein PLK34_03165 [Candidatus Pacearchaeota archaeon]|nr:hypothetical protein [Candidatus Pacearchaeota archaeon]
MNQTNNVLFPEEYNSFKVRGEAVCIGSKRPLNGEIRNYWDGKIVGVISDENSSDGSKNNLVLGFQDKAHLTFWSLSSIYSGEIYAMVKEDPQGRKYHGGRGYAPTYLSQFVERMSNSFNVRKLFLGLERKPVSEILDYAGKIDTKLIEASFGRAVPEKIFREDCRNCLELIALN